MWGSQTAVALLLVAAACAADPCRFAARYTVDQIATDAAARERFVREAMAWEGKFVAEGAGTDPRTGLTVNGLTLDYATGMPNGAWNFSASSKEMLHLGLLAAVVAGDARALATGLTREQALATLRRKVNTYLSFYAEFPGYGGFLPWYQPRASGGIEPTWDWVGRVPSLDNGQLAWSVLAVIPVLRDAGESELAGMYQKYADILASNVVAVFHDGGGRLRTVSRIRDVKAQPSPANYYNDTPCGPCVLDDTYEGELMVWFADLFGQWEDPADRERVWELKREKIQRAEFLADGDPITVPRGWWFSAHEMWKYLAMPYDDVPLMRRLHMNSERARTWFSNRNGFPGLFASVTLPNKPEVTPPPFSYASDSGIESISFNPVTHNELVTPYGAFPVILADESVGLAWYLTMLQGPSMQGQYGSTESVFIDGTGICPCLTWDSKTTTALAMLGGTSKLTKRVLVELGHWDRFSSILEREYGRVFPDLKGEDKPLQLPSSSIAHRIPDFTTCRA